MAGLDIAQLKYLVVQPSLTAIGLSTPAALSLVTGTALVESGAAFLRQHQGGPALGLWQVEPATEQDIWDNFLRFRPALAARVRTLLASGATTPQLIGNLGYGAAICRLQYFRSPLALPAADDAAAMAVLHKQIYNTAAGAARIATSRPLFRQAIIA